MSEQLKITTDYHVHSTFSSDGRHPPAILCQRALDVGLKEIAITEHAEWHAGISQQGFPQVTEYFAAIEQCRVRFEPLGLTIHAGVELGNPHQYPQEAKALLAAYPFDVVIGSLHWLYGENIHLESCFAKRSPDDVYADYFTELERMAANFELDFVAHFDRIIWRGTLMGATFDPQPLEPVIQQALATIARRGQALELNTRYLTHTPSWNEALVTMLRWFRLAGGARIVVNSDAHRAEEIGRNLGLAQEILVRAGFKLPEQLLKIGATAAKSLPLEPTLNYWSELGDEMRGTSGRFYQTPLQVW
ncbi:MAG: histidinol-phosphatase HisJ family protein [Anaerolineae bacterium]|nr:histidinol-phosphatase HisJ family protein [Anaerolineae bacterium]